MENSNYRLVEVNEEDRIMNTMKWRCPECGNEKNLLISGRVWLVLTQDEDNYETEPVDQDHDWDGDSFMQCSKCGHYAESRMFEEAYQAPDPVPGVILLNNLDEGVVEDLFALPSPEMDEAIHEEAMRLLKEMGGEKADSSKYGAIMQEIYESLEEIDFPKEGEVDGVGVRLFELGGAWHVMVLSSPYTTRASACSPCVPGAADLDSRHDGGLLCYDVPSSWRRKESQEGL